MKADFVGHALEDARQFPPLKSGGLIEGARAGDRRHTRRWFPPLKSGGLIEGTDRYTIRYQFPHVSSAEERRPH